MAYERRPDGGLQWVRSAPARLDQNKVTFVQVRRRRRSHRGFVSDRFTMDDQIRQDLPSFPEIERLLAIYVATGEGRGAYRAAKASEKTRGPHYGLGSSSDDHSGPYPPGPPQEPPDGFGAIRVYLGARPERPVSPMEEDVGDQEIGGPAAPREQRVDNVSQDEDGSLLYTTLPLHEDDFRINTQTRSSRRRRPSGMRGGGGLDYDPEEAQSGGEGLNFLRLRGGNVEGDLLTSTSAISPDSDKIDTTSRPIK